MDVGAAALIERLEEACRSRERGVSKLLLCSRRQGVGTKLPDANKYGREGLLAKSVSMQRSATFPRLCQGIAVQ